MPLEIKLTCERCGHVELIADEKELRKRCAPSQADPLGGPPALCGPCHVARHRILEGAYEYVSACVQAWDAKQSQPPPPDIW